MANIKIPPHFWLGILILALFLSTIVDSAIWIMSVLSDGFFNAIAILCAWKLFQALTKQG